MVLVPTQPDEPGDKEAVSHVQFSDGWFVCIDDAAIVVETAIVTQNGVDEDELPLNPQPMVDLAALGPPYEFPTLRLGGRRPTIAEIRV
jgi:hypothetical protein